MPKTKPADTAEFKREVLADGRARTVRMNLKTAVEPRIDPNGPGYQTDGNSERLTHEVKPVPRLYTGWFVCAIGVFS